VTVTPHHAPWPRRAVYLLGALLLAIAGLLLSAPDRASATDALALETMTWNACANTEPPASDVNHPRCIYGQQTDKIAADIDRRITDLHPGVRVVLLQEVCYADIEKLRDLVAGSGWTFRFTGIKDEGSGSSPTGTVAARRCADDVHTGAYRGNFGIAIGVKGASATYTVHYYPDAHQPMARDIWKHWNVRQAAICADVAAWNLRACGTHLTPNPSGSPAAMRAAQAAQVKDLVGYAGTGHRVIAGGDLNTAPPAATSSSTVGPLYDAFTECDQANYGGARNGQGTYQRDDGTRASKLDYLFADKSAATSCYVTDAEIQASDHIPVFATTTYPAA
jgi:endonuclease/exonuclease/phosphatase family metal-dependent hydrolase